MAATGEYPKANADVLYGEDVNMSYYNFASSSTMNHGSASVTATATQIIAANTSRKSILVRNILAANDLFIGGSASVTASTGFKIRPLESIYILDQDEIYGICGTGLTTTARYLETE